MQQQQLMQMQQQQQQPMMSSYYPNNVTTDHIQQYLDENKSLILKIVESQNTGKLNECAENQARLQRNLMYLAAIADSQPQPPSMNSQFASAGLMQQGGTQFMQQQQQQQQQQMTAAQSMMAVRSSMLYNNQNHMYQQQTLNSQLGLHMLPTEASGIGGYPDFVSRGSKQDSEGRGGNSMDGGDTGLYLKSNDNAN